MSEVPSQAIQEKAAKMLLAGCVKVQYLLAVSADESDKFLAHVKPLNGGDPYHVQFNQNGWHCDCVARVQVCAHVLACQTITPDLTVSNKPPSLPTDDDIAKLLGLDT